MSSEDRRQILTGLETHNKMDEDDCETDALMQMVLNKGLIPVGSSARKLLLSIGFDNKKCQFATTADILASGKLNPQEFGVCPKLFAGHSEEEQQLIAAGIVNFMQFLHEDPEVFLITGNAFAPSAGEAAATQPPLSSVKEVCGHCYCGMNAPIVNIPATIRSKKLIVKTSKTILESTKWVNTRNSCQERSTKRMDPQITKLQNQGENLLGEITKVASMDPTQDVVNTQLNVFADNEGQGNEFYALGYIYDGKYMFSRSVPGVKNSPLVFGVSVGQYMNGDENLLFECKEAKYELLTTHLQNAGLKHIASGDIQKKIMDCAMANSIPHWPAENWEKYVFDTYIPCSKLYEDAEALKLFRGDGTCKVRMHETGSSPGNTYSNMQ